MLICSKTTFCRNFGIRTARGPRPWLTAIAPYLSRMEGRAPARPYLWNWARIVQHGRAGGRSR